MSKPMNEFQKGKENAKEKDVTNSTDSQPIYGKLLGTSGVP